MGFPLDLYAVIVQRYNIPLKWLDIKRVQYPGDARDTSVINATINHSVEASFTPGWLNDEVRNSCNHQCVSEVMKGKVHRIFGILHDKSFFFSNRSLISISA